MESNKEIALAIYKQEVIDSLVKQIAHLDVEIICLKEKQDDIIRDICKKQIERTRLMQRLNDEHITPF